MDSETEIASLGRLARFTAEHGGAENRFWDAEKAGKPPADRLGYVDGLMLHAMLELSSAAGEERYLGFADSFLESFVGEDGSFRGFDPESCNPDDINAAKVLIPLYENTGKKKYLLAAQTVYRAMIRLPRTREGNFWHKRVYPNQVWLDGLYMVMPFYMEYETKYNGMRGCRDIFTQFLNVRRLMRDGTTGLYFHGYDESRQSPWAGKEDGLSQCFWLRAIGWLFMALVDTLEKTDEQLYYDYRTLGAMLKDLAESLIPFQAENGMFLQVVDRTGDADNYPESSGTLMVAYGILKAVRLRLLPERFRSLGEKALAGTLRRYYQDGNPPSLGGICLVGGLGGPAGRDGSPAYYYGEPVAVNDGKGLGPLFLCYAEELRMRKSGGTV